MSRTPSYIQLAPRRAMASFENLVALANHQERLREARRIVWRERGEPAVELEDLWECMEHAGRGGLRAAAIAFALRASVNLVLATIRMGKVPKNMRLSLIQHAIFGKDSFRFAAMFGSFVTIYKATLNALPILIPVNERASPPSPFEDEDEDIEAPPTPFEVPLSARQPRLSLSAQAHQVWVRKKTRRWHSMFAGALAGGLAVMFEKRSRRVVIAQQLFVRGLQGSYNAFTSKHGFHLPNGEVLMFCLCSTQIVYALFARPDTLPRSYTAWLTTASGAPSNAIKIVQDMNKTGTFDVQDLNKILSREDLIPANQVTLLASRAMATNSPPDFGPYPLCGAVHPWVESCTHVPLPRFVTVFKWAFPIYGALHFVPMILFKRHAFLRNPLQKLGRAGWATIRSSAFLATFIATFQTWVCFKHYLYRMLSSQTLVKLPQKFIDFFVSKYSYGLGGLFGALSLFVEEKRRRGELAMYVLPKGMESAWLTARGKGWVFHTGQFGEMILTAIGMSMVMVTHSLQNDPQHLSGLVRRILFQFIGPN
ncbi:hypothetical protein DFJ58DRAFT_658336 [Suillus subalutaceus]|uniref:uncharacterized protein n=1 Tax=Suillus subalutaceus TaxID=48586 RepID=UPI001B86E02A|nr:uncharacterized protein DFJ58DRAFT_658336 [Suillus subalutaceus]KAG1859359.1 hypothetical protein DFJ58DRAFT_658336 [Suillus subalutaceus]